MSNPTSKQEIFGAELRCRPVLEGASNTKEGWTAEMEQHHQGEWIARESAEFIVRDLSNQVHDLKLERDFHQRTSVRLGGINVARFGQLRDLLKSWSLTKDDGLRDETSAERPSTTFLLARLGTILNVAEGELTAKAQQEIARLAREVVRPTTSLCTTCGHGDRYHFDDGNGNVICRWSADCHCAHRVESIRQEEPEAGRDADRFNPAIDSPEDLPQLCEGCPPIDYPTDTTRCAPCPRRLAVKASRECCLDDPGGGFVCTLPKGHAGQHEAYGTHHNLLQTWSTENGSERT